MICPKAKSATHCLTELFSIYQNKHGTIRRRDDHIVVQLTHRNISKIDGFNESVQSYYFSLDRGTNNPILRATKFEFQTQALFSAMWSPTFLLSSALTQQKRQAYIRNISAFVVCLSAYLSTKVEHF